MYERLLINYLISKRRELYYYKHFPLNYIKSGMSMNRRVYEKMRRNTHTSPDKGWINIYRKEISKEIYLRVDPTSLILKDFHICMYVYACMYVIKNSKYNNHLE